MKNTDRIGIALFAVCAAMIVTPVAAQTVVIDGSGVRSEGSGTTVSDGVLPALPRGGAPARATLPYNTSRGPVLAGQDTSLPPRQFSSQNRIVLRPPGQKSSAANRPAVTQQPATGSAAPRSEPPAPKPVARAEPVRPAPAPEPAASPATDETPKAPAKVERPAVSVTRPVAKAQTTPVPTPEPVPAPKPAATPAPKPAEQPKVAAVVPQAAAPNLSRIDFSGTDTEVSAAGRAQLEQIAAGAKDDRNIRIQVKAYADSATETDVWKRRVSLRRAQNVRRILLDNGIESFRILVRALGAPGPDDDAPGNRVDIEIGRR